MTVEAEGSMLLPEFWGLDPLFRSEVKLFISDILDMEMYPTAEIAGVYAYKNHPVTKVSISGIVVKVICKDRFTVYAVDDSTGVINCFVWNKTSQNDVATTAASLPDSFQSKLAELASLQSQTKEGFHLGDYIKVKGRIKTYRGIKEIMASHSAKIIDVNQESIRKLQTVQLYLDVYDVPFKMPDNLADGADLKKRLEVKKMKSCIIQHLSQQKAPVFSAEDLQDMPHSSTSTGNALVMEGAIALLLEEGQVYKDFSSKESHFRFVPKDTLLHDTVLKVLGKECTKQKYVDQGCHYLHIYDELRKQLLFSSLTKAAVAVCMNRLEEQSLVISTTEKHYIVLDT